jgi:hypothetical protein
MSETVEGLTLEQYARLAVALHRVDESEWDAVAATFGVGPGRVTALGEAWQAKLTADPSLAIAYNDLYQRAMVEAGITAPEVSLEQYADMLRSGGPTPEVLAKYGIDVQQFSMISHRMGQAMMADVGLAQRFAQLMMPQGGQPG